jgi:hypothetical protein
MRVQRLRGRHEKDIFDRAPTLCFTALVRPGISLFKLKQNSHPATDFNGLSASAVSYFDGDDVALAGTLLDDSAFA